MLNVLDRIASVEGAVLRAEQRHALWVREQRSLTEKLLGLADEADQVWAAICRAVLDGRTAEGHASRDRLHQVVENVLARLREGARLLSEPFASPATEHAERVARVWRGRFARWATADDLEGLVANETAPTQQQVNAVMQKFGPPPSWLAEETFV